MSEGLKTTTFERALVTGASSGIGRALAAALRSLGMDVIAVGRDEQSLTRLAEECGVRPHVADVRDVGTFASLFKSERIDVLINNAGILSSRDRFQSMDADLIDAMVGVNLIAPLHLARLALPPMIKRGLGHLFFIGSSTGRYPHGNAAVYGASKAGISMFCDSLRLDLLGTGIRVTEICPGRVETRLYRTTAGEAAKSELYDGYGAVEPADIAKLLVTALSLPANVDVSRLEVFPTTQAVGGSQIVKARLQASR